MTKIVEIVAMRGNDLPDPIRPGTTYTTTDLALRDALLRRGAIAIYACRPLQPREVLTARILSLSTGTLFLDEGRFDAPAGSATLAPQQRALAEALADGDWHDAEALEEALYREPGPPSRLQSAIARLRATLGGAIDSAYGGGWRLRAVGARRPAPTLVDMLDATRPTPSATLEAVLGCTAGALRARIQRLRRSGVPVVFARGGYVLDLEEATPRQAVADALRAHPLVNLWGPIGVGKSFLLRELGGAAVTSLSGMRGPLLERRLRAMVDRPPATLYLDGVEDPPALDFLREAGHRVLIATRAPIPGAFQVAFPPWAAEQLARKFPEHDTTAWDGLPLGACRDAEIRARVERTPALDAAVAQIGEAWPSALGAAACAILRRQGVLLGRDRVRLPGPLIRAMRASWTDEEWISAAARFSAECLELVYRQQHLDAIDALRREGIALLSELERRDLPTGGLLVVLYDATILGDAERLRAALSRSVDRDERAQLLYRIGFLSRDPTCAALRQAIAEASEPLAHELQLELAYETWSTDPEGALLLFADTRRWLDGQPPDAHLWVRNEWLVSKALRDPRGTRPEELIRQYLTLAQVSFSPSVPKLRWMRVQCLHALGTCALVHDELATAVSALEEVVLRLGERSVVQGGLDLLLAYTRQRDWPAAERLWERIGEAALTPIWDELRRGIRAMQLLGQGRLADALDVTATLPATDFLVGLAAALQGQVPPPQSAYPEVLKLVHRAVLSGSEEDRIALSGLQPHRWYSGPHLAQLVATHT